MEGHDPALPSGDVTFVFSDIEASTRLFRRLGDDYASVLDLHDELLREAWTDHGGHEMGKEGDSFFVAFHDPTSAVLACAQAQESLVTANWPHGAALRVRMGIHSGLARPRSNQYVSFAVHQASRVANAGQGSHIVATAEVADRADLPPDLEFELRGRYRLRDFDEPPRLFVLRGDRIGTNRGILRAPPADGHNVPYRPTKLFGRENELKLLADRLSTSRLVTVTGPGGVGKTRLAEEFAIRHAGEWPHGVWLVALDPVESSELIPALIVQAVGARTTPGEDPWNELIDFFTARKVLVVIDNCEHILDGAARTIAKILHSAPLVHVLATSRSPLGLAGESVFALGPLELGSGNQPGPAEELFIDRARAVAPDQAQTHDSEGVRGLCAALDSLPLALELAAARSNVMMLHEILVVARQDNQLLRSPDPTTSPRHRTLHDLIEWSYKLLRENERVALRRLAVVPVDFNLEIAAACIDATPEEAAVLVWSLAEASLISVSPSTGGSSRFRFLRTVKADSLKRTSDSEVDAVFERLEEHFVSTIGPERIFDWRWISAVAEELDNLRGLIVRTCDSGQTRRQQLAWTVGRYHDVTDSFDAGRSELTGFLGILDSETPERVALLTQLADIHLRVADLAGGTDALRSAEVLRDRVGSAAWDDAGVLRTTGEVELRRGNYAAAVEIAESVSLSSISLRGTARLHNLRGIAYLSDDDFMASYDAFSAEVEAWEQLGVGSASSIAHGNLAEVAFQLGRTKEASALQKRCLDLALEFGLPVPLAFSLIVSARLASEAGSWREAVSLHSSGDAILSKTKFILHEFDAAQRSAFFDDALIELGPVELERMTSHGRQRSVSDAVDSASRELEMSAN